MHGTGNLILVVDQRAENRPPPSADKLRLLGADDTGPGFDQMMWVIPSDDATCVAAYRVFNADGSEVEQCGNGVRCVAKYLVDTGAADGRFTLQSPAGPITAEVFDDGMVAVSMGAPVFEPAAIPFIAAEPANTYTLEVDENPFTISALSMGNPHAVMLVPDVDEVPVAELGPLIERHERFPERCNVGFMRIHGRTRIDLRVFERGVGETAACGTGACAAVVSGQRLGLLADEVAVRLPGGELVVSWHDGGSPVWLKGNAELIEDGTLDLDE